MFIRINHSNINYKWLFPILNNLIWLACLEKLKGLLSKSDQVRDVAGRKGNSREDQEQ